MRAMTRFLVCKPRSSLFTICLCLLLASTMATAQEVPEYVGAPACGSCHAGQLNAWQDSHHDLAMQVAGEDTVLGDFDDATFEHAGVTTTFFRRDGRFIVRTEGPDGALHDYPVAYTFGVDPLQQYLVAFPRGRYQALTVAWDSRPAAAGGQRWFHLYPGARIASDSPLHWTGIEHNWNSRCAACHSTNLRKNYDIEGNSYSTKWSEINVACEACHGPGSRHVAWAKSGADTAGGENNGLVVRFDSRDAVRWPIVPETGNAHRVPDRDGDTDIESCAACHSRRAEIWSPASPGAPLLDAYLPSLLRSDLYHADGQILDEVYVYGSFLQSKMHHAGVGCGDCHDPHSLELRVPGNGVCLQCHLSDKYDATAHHFHAPESAGAECVGCHMPAKTYMVVDPRRDHSLRIPRPDYSMQFGTPNACNDCHDTQDAKWSLEHVQRWYGKNPKGYQRFTPALAAARADTAEAARLLAALADNRSAPAIARATALAGLGGHLTPATFDVVRRGLVSKDARMRVAAVDALERLAPAARPRLLLPLLEDPVRAVRIQAAARLAPVPLESLGAADRALLQRGIEEYIAAQQVNADRPEANLNLGVLYADLGRLDRAERATRRALERQATFVPAYVNLAEIHRLQGRDADAEAVLRSGLQAAPNDAGLHHALGLALVRKRDLQQALPELERSAELDPGNPRFSYVYAVALASAGRSSDAVRILEEAHGLHPGNREILFALTDYHRGTGNRDAALVFARRLVALDPRDARARELLNQLGAE
jgi:Flp pilus assembly protein TadD